MFLPQVIKTWRTRQTRDISLGMFSVLCTGISLWVAYGIFRKDFPLVPAGIILALKLRF